MLVAARLRRFAPVGFGAAIGLMLTGFVTAGALESTPTVDAEATANFAPSTTLPGGLDDLLPDLRSKGLVLAPGGLGAHLLPDADAAADVFGDTAAVIVGSLADTLRAAGYVRGATATWYGRDNAHVLAVEPIVWELRSTEDAAAVGAMLGAEDVPYLSAVDPGIDGFDAGGYRFDQGEVHGIYLYAVRGDRVLRVLMTTDTAADLELARSVLRTMVEHS